MHNKKLMELHKSIWKNVAQIEYKDITPYINKFKLLDDLTPVGTSFFIIVNLSTYKYEFLGSNQTLVTGYDNELVRRQGIQFLADHVHPEDGEYIIKKGYAKFAEMLKNEGERQKLVMQSNFRLRHKDGHYIHLVEQNQLMDMKGVENLNFVLTYICELPLIEPFKGNIIIKNLMSDDQGHEDVYRESYPDKKEAMLSERELEIVRLIAKGNNSDQVAEKLSISPHTVRTHRKNLLAKMGMNSTNEVIAYTITTGLI